MIARIGIHLRSIWRIVRAPRSAESVRQLRQSWANLPEHLRTPKQMFGVQGNGCGATIGLLPRCDFACHGCYLGEDANHAQPLPVLDLQAQLRQLRHYLGNAGNLQLTDGEVTLRDEAELRSLIRYANELGLVPMLMTHGDSFRRRPGLLERLMETGLREVSLHIDTTMRGRTGNAYRQATNETELDPLRSEFAERIRTARRVTRRPLRCASTATITPRNIVGVPGVLRRLLSESDVFKMVSFQPVAQVGRTQPGLGGGVSADALWRRIGEGLDCTTSDLERSRMWLGHPECSRFVHGFVLRRLGQAPRFHTLWREGVPLDDAAVHGYLKRFGGVSFRRDDRLARWTRALALFVRAPHFWSTTVTRFAWAMLGRLSGGRRLSLLRDFMTSRASLSHFIVASHHFMSREELETERGRERVDECVFRVPVGDEMISMCAVNAQGVRKDFYASNSAS